MNYGHQPTMILSAGRVSVCTIFLTIQKDHGCPIPPLLPLPLSFPPPPTSHLPPFPSHLAISPATLPGAAVVSGRGTSMTSPSPIPNPILNFTCISTGMRMWPSHTILNTHAQTHYSDLPPLQTRTLLRGPPSSKQRTGGSCNRAVYAGPTTGSN